MCTRVYLCILAFVFVRESCRCSDKAGSRVAGWEFCVSDACMPVCSADDCPVVCSCTPGQGWMRPVLCAFVLSGSLLNHKPVSGLTLQSIRHVIALNRTPHSLNHFGTPSRFLLSTVRMLSFFVAICAFTAKVLRGLKHREEERFHWGISTVMWLSEILCHAVGLELLLGKVRRFAESCGFSLCKLCLRCKLTPCLHWLVGGSMKT